jgi:hypothetical protein
MNKQVTQFLSQNEIADRIMWCSNSLSRNAYSYAWNQFIWAQDKGIVYPVTWEFYDESSYLLYFLTWVDSA